MKMDETNLGNYAKIVAPEIDDNYGKIGFIGAIVQKHVMLFSIYRFEGDQIVGLGDYSGSELMMLEKKVSKNDLIRRINSKLVSEVMIEEMQRLLKSIYKT